MIKNKKARPESWAGYFYRQRKPFTKVSQNQDKNGLGAESPIKPYRYCRGGVTTLQGGCYYCTGGVLLLQKGGVTTAPHFSNPHGYWVCGGCQTLIILIILIILRGAGFF